MPITVFFLILFFNSYKITFLAIISYIFTTIIDILNYIVFKKGKDLRFIYAHKSFMPNMNQVKASVIRGFLEISFLPHKAYISCLSIIKTIYRINVSKKHLLEWMTADEAEKNSKNDLLSYYKFMVINLIVGVFSIIFGTALKNVMLVLLGTIWCLAPFVSWYISRPIKDVKSIDKISKNDKEYLIDIGKKTWIYFKENMNEENNFLPPDNFQEDRLPKIAERTSTTNIGLGLISIISAYDLKYIDLEEAIDMLEKVFITISKLKRFNGHLYNWYNTKTLEPLFPRYISTVDNGNFIGYLYTTKIFLEKQIKEKSSSNSSSDSNGNNNNMDRLIKMINIIEEIINTTDFSFLYDSKKHLFSIGFDVEQGKLTNSYYDLLASEARQASLIAIAKKDISFKHWNYLSKTLTCLNMYKGLISWSGTAFEYLMPNINIKEYEGSLLDESCRFLIYSQMEYSKKLGLPFGISEAAFSLKDLNNNYQYKSFGIPWLGLKRGLENNIVISPYSTFLSLKYVPEECILNLKKLQSLKMCGEYGFYESIDFTSSRLKFGEKFKIVKTYMAHHQALSLASINNLINNDILNNRFMSNPEIKGVSILLQERMPDKAIITKEKKEKVQKIKPKDYQNYIEKVYTNENLKLKSNGKLNISNTISNGKYTVFTMINGEGFSKYKDILVNRFKQTEDLKQGIFFFIKNVESKILWTNTNLKEKYDNNSKTTFAPERNEFLRTDGNIETKTKIIVTPDDNVEIRRLELKNNGTNEETLEVTSFFEPVLSKPMQDYSHMAFNNLFLTFEKQDDVILVKRKKRLKEENDIYLSACLYTEDETIGDLEYEIDKEKIYSRKLELIPNNVKESKPFSKNLGLVTDPCLAMRRTIKIKPSKSVTIDLILCISEQREIAEKLIEKYKNYNVITKAFDLAKAKVEADTIYLGLKGKDIEKYQKLLSYTILTNPLKRFKDSYKSIKDRIYSQSKLWKYGISGDLPIILVKIENLNDVYVVEDILKAYEFYLSRNIKIDLVIVDYEESSYEQYINDEIENLILNKQMEYLKNRYGGIFVLNSNKIDKEDLELLLFKSNFIIDSKYGDIKNIIDDLEEEYLKQLKNLNDRIEKEGNKDNSKYIDNIKDINEENLLNNTSDSNNQILNINLNELKYFNEFGGFNEDGSEYRFKLEKDKNLPTVWSNILANKTFGTIVTQNLGGYTWHKNSRLNRLSSWCNNQLFDTPSEIIYLKDKKTGKKWTLSNNLNDDNNENNNADSYITYGFGYVKFQTIKNNIEHELTIFVPKKDNVKINILNLKNLEPYKRNLKLVYYIKPVLGEDEIKTNGFIKLEKDGNFIRIKNLYKDSFKNNYAYVSSSEHIKSFTGNKDFFLGDGSISIPSGLDKSSLDNSDGLNLNSCVAIEIETTLESFETKDIIFEFGEEETLIEAKDVSYKYSNLSNSIKELNDVKKYWYELLNTVQVKTPIESLDLILNGWAKYQTITSRLWSRTGYFQSGGAIGFRDQLQDTLGLKYVDIDFMKKQILLACRHQFIEGDVEHWWHEDTNRGIRTRFSDDLLWLCFVVSQYIEFTGDYSILDEKEPYVMGELLKERRR